MLLEGMMDLIIIIIKEKYKHFINNVKSIQKNCYTSSELNLTSESYVNAKNWDWTNIYERM